MGTIIITFSVYLVYILRYNYIGAILSVWIKILFYGLAIVLPRRCIRFDIIVQLMGYKVSSSWFTGQGCVPKSVLEFFERELRANYGLGVLILTLSQPFSECQ